MKAKLNKRKDAVLVLVPVAFILGVIGPSFAQTGAPSPPAVPVSGSTVTGGPAAGSTAQISIPLPPITIAAELDKPRLSQDDTLSLIVSLSWDSPAAGLAFPIDFDFPEPPRAEGFTLYANSSRTTTVLSGATVRVTTTYTYKFIADLVTRTEIGPVMVHCSRPGSPDKLKLSTPALPVTVTKAAFNPARIFGPGGIKLVLLLIILAAAAGLLYPALKKRRKKKAPTVVMEKPPLESARERLREIDRLRMAGDYQGHVRGLAQEVSRCLAEVMGLKMRGQTPDKIAGELAERLGEEWRERYLEFEKICGRVKFAGHQPDSAELDRAMKTGRELIEAAHQKAQPGNKTDGNSPGAALPTPRPES